MRRATLRGTENQTKRLTAAALVYDLSLLMQKLVGVGTPKQWAAKACLFVWALQKRAQRALQNFPAANGHFLTTAKRKLHSLREMLQKHCEINPMWRFLTGC